MQMSAKYLKQAKVSSFYTLLIPQTPMQMSAQYLKQAQDSSFHIFPVPQTLQLNVTTVRQTDSNHSIIQSFEAVQFVTDRFVRVSTKNIHIFQATSATLSFDNKGKINHVEAPFPCQSHNLKHVVH